MADAAAAAAPGGSFQPSGIGGAAVAGQRGGGRLLLGDGSGREGDGT